MFLYDEAGNALMELGRDGRGRVHTYDALNRRVRTEYFLDTQTDFPDAPAEVERVVYDGFGDRVQVANTEVSYTYTLHPAP